jgi:hypothetical protein
MAITVNNTTANQRITIIFDADINKDNENDGPRFGTGNTESDILIDNKAYHNIRSHTEIDANVHALQWNATTNTGELEYIDNRDNESLSSFPQWASNVVIRCEAQDAWHSSYDANVAEQFTAWQAVNPGVDEENFIANTSQAMATADSVRINYLSTHGITY